MYKTDLGKALKCSWKTQKIGSIGECLFAKTVIINLSFPVWILFYDVTLLLFPSRSEGYFLTSWFVCLLWPTEQQQMGYKQRPEKHSHTGACQDHLCDLKWTSVGSPLQMGDHHPTPSICAKWDPLYRRLRPPKAIQPQPRPLDHKNHPRTIRNNMCMLF